MLKITNERIALILSLLTLQNIFNKRIKNMEHFCNINAVIIR